MTIEQYEILNLLLLIILLILGAANFYAACIDSWRQHLLQRRYDKQDAVIKKSMHGMYEVSGKKTNANP